ncbi:MAG: tyrosine-type recombinase/integrase, partial [Acidobacteriota bacterium]
MHNYGFVSTLAERLSEYVKFRTLGGVDAGGQVRLLRHFDCFLHRDGFQGPWPPRDVVGRYLATMEHLQPGSRGNRLSVVRQFCRYLRQFEPECYIPQRILALERRPSRVPHLFTENEIKAMLEAARHLAPPGSLRPQTYFTLLGLLYTTGLRWGEAFALNLPDVDLQKKLLYVRKGKFGKSRLVPLSSSTSMALERY